MAQQQRARVTRERVLEGAAEVFARSGYAGASLSEIAAESGLSKGAMYFHFTSKEEIARAIVAIEQSVAAESAAQAIARANSALEAVMGLCVDFSEHVGRGGAIMRAGVRLTTDGATFEPPLRAPFEDWIPLIAQLLSTSVAEGDVKPEHDPQTLAQFVIPAFTGVQLVSGALTGFSDLNERLRDMWQILLPSMVRPERVQASLDALDRLLPATEGRPARSAGATSA